MPWQGTIQRPSPLRKSWLARPRRPRRRAQWVSAKGRAVARYASRVRLKACPCAENIILPPLALRRFRFPWVLTRKRDRTQLPDQSDNRRSDGDKNDRRQNKNYQWGNHLNRSLGGLLFGALPAFGAQRVGMY